VQQRCSWNIFKVYYFCCVEFLCILFSRIFSMCLRPLGASPSAPTGTLPLHPTGGLLSSRPLLLSPVANSWLRPCPTFLDNEHDISRDNGEAQTFYLPLRPTWLCACLCMLVCHSVNRISEVFGCSEPHSTRRGHRACKGGKGLQTTKSAFIRVQTLGTQTKHTGFGGKPV